MIVPATRIVARWLREHPVYSVAAHLQRTTPDDEDVLPPLGFPVLSDVDDEQVARKYDSDAERAIVVVGEIDPTVAHERKRSLLAARIGWGVSYVVRDIQSITKERQRAEYALRAVMDSLLALNEPLLAGEWRVRDGVTLLKFDEFAESRTVGGLGSATLMGSVLVVGLVSRITPV
jgi:hypothetical protein